MLRCFSSSSHSALLRSWFHNVEFTLATDTTEDQLGTLIQAVDQEFTIESTTFDDVRVAADVEQAAALLSCAGRAVCTLKDSCFNDITYTSGMMVSTSAGAVSNAGTIGSVVTENLFWGPEGQTVQPTN